MEHFLNRKPIRAFAFLLLFLGACATAAENEETAVEPTDEPTATAVPPSSHPAAAATATAVAATDTLELEPTASPEPTATPEPTVSPEPTPAPTAESEPLFELGATANWTETNDPIGIEGEIEYISATEIVIRNFVFLAEEAPGVVIRLGVGDDFSDEVAVSLRDITGRTYEGRTVSLTIPPAGFDGRTFNSIGVYCYDTGDLFDWAVFEVP